MSSYNPVLPPYVAPKAPLNRPSAGEINRTQSERTSDLYSGYGEILPIVYGEERLAGLIIAGPVVRSGRLVMAVAWSYAAPYGIEGVQRVIVDGKTPTSSEVTVTHYNGLQTTANQRLRQVFPGFADVFKGVAYSVFDFAARSTGGFPKIEAIVRGRKVLDPRDNAVKFTHNPALQLNDFVTNADFGAGKTVYNIKEAADFSDSIVSGIVRNESTIVIDRPHTFSAIADLFCAYGELLWGYEADGIRVVPDYLVDDSKMIRITQDQIVDRTLKLNGLDTTGAPNKVILQYINPTEVEGAWQQETVEVEEREVTSGLAHPATSKIELNGVRREPEALRKAVTRLKQGRIPSSVSFQMLDSAVFIQTGDVLILPDTLGLGDSFRARVKSNEMVSPTVHQITAETYSAETYSFVDEQPSTAAVIPVGGVVFSGSQVAPAGFEALDTGRRLIKAGNEYSKVGVDTYTVAAEKITIEAAGGHASGDLFPIANYTDRVQGFSAIIEAAYEGHHTHTVHGNVIFTGPPDSYGFYMHRNTSLPVRLPIGCSVLSDKELIGNVEMLKTDGDLISVGSVGFKSQGIASTVTLAAVGAHNHSYTNQPARVAQGPDYGQSSRTGLTSEGAHSHRISFKSLEPEMKRCMMLAYTAILTANVPTGSVIGYLGTGLPAGWQECNGQNGTVDLRDCYLALTDKPNRAGKQQTTGSNTAKLQTSADGAHTHYQVGSTREWANERAGHDPEPNHTHNVEFSIADYVPPTVIMRFIQFTGAGL